MDKVVRGSILQQSLGLKIRRLRKTAGMNAVELASRVGISQGQLSKIETGKATLSINNLAGLCRVLNFPLSDLFLSEESVSYARHKITAVAGLENQGLHWLSREISTNTNSEVKLQTIGSLQFGPATDQIDLILNGNVDLFVEDPAQFHKIVPALKLLELPYGFRDEPHRQTFLSSPYFKENVIKVLSRQGLCFLNPNWNWIRGLTWVLVSRKPICVPEDIKGLRIRIYDSEPLSYFWTKLGATPVVIPWPDVREAVASGDVDVLPTSKAFVYHNGFCEHAKFVTLLGDLPTIMGVFMSIKKFRSFSPEIQRALQTACDNAGNIFAADLYHIEKRNEALNLSRNRAVYLKVDIAPWRSAVLKIRAEMMHRGILPATTPECVLTA